MRNGLQRLFDAAPAILLLLAGFIFAAQLLAFEITDSHVGYAGPNRLLGLLSMIIAAAIEPAKLIGLAAITQYLTTRRSA